MGYHCRKCGQPKAGHACAVRVREELGRDRSREFAQRRRRVRPDAVARAAAVRARFDAAPQTPVRKDLAAADLLALLPGLAAVRPPEAGAAAPEAAEAVDPGGTALSASDCEAHAGLLFDAAGSALSALASFLRMQQPRWDGLPPCLDELAGVQRSLRKRRADLSAALRPGEIPWSGFGRGGVGGGGV